MAAKKEDKKEEKKPSPKKQTSKPASTTQSKKTAPKKSAPKSTAAKSTAPKAAPAKKQPAKQDVDLVLAPEKRPKRRRKKAQAQPEQKPLFQKKTIAQRTVDWKTGKTTRLLRWLAILPLLLLIVFFTFFMAGYSFTVLVCWCLIGILMFYNIADLLTNKYPRQIRAVRRLFSTLLCIGLLVVGITECLIIHASFGDPKESCEYIVVLGAKVRPDGPSVSLMDRISAAHVYMTEHPEVIAVVSGGKGEDEPMTEAQCMYEELTALGIDPGRIWMENKATSTWENMHYTLDLIEEKTGTRPTKLGVISSEYHLFRASLFADACGIESVGIPAVTSRLSQKVNHFMREVAGVWHYLLLGGQYHD